MTKIAHLITGVVTGILLTTFAFPRQSNTETLDPVKLSPHMYRVLLDNDKVRAIDYQLKPGEQEPLHSHPSGVFVYYFTDSNMAVTLPGGKTGESHNRAGDVVWRDPVTHLTKNIGNAEVHALLVEPKQSCK